MFACVDTIKALWIKKKVFWKKPTFKAIISLPLQSMLGAVTVTSSVRAVHFTVLLTVATIGLVCLQTIKPFKGQREGEGFKKWGAGSRTPRWHFYHKSWHIVSRTQKGTGLSCVFTSFTATAEYCVYCTVYCTRVCVSFITLQWEKWQRAARIAPPVIHHPHRHTTWSPFVHTTRGGCSSR